MAKASGDKILQDDYDFLVEVIYWRGQPAVRKSIKPTTMPERANRLKNEFYALRFWADLANRHKNLELYIPKLYAVTEQYIIRGFIDEPPVGDNQQNLHKLAKLLADIDRIESYGEAKITPHFDYQNIRANFSKWTEKPLQQGLITQSQIDKANQIIDKLEPYLEPRIAHGDLSPYAHAFVRNDGKIALVDLEVFTPRGARYYDVARCYTRLFQAAKSTDTPKKFLSHFLKYADSVDYRTEQLLAIFTQRAIAMQRDAAIDADKGDDYKQRAAELLDLALQTKLDVLCK